MYLQEATTKRTGPNDAKRVVWAISKFFFIKNSHFFIFINNLTGINDILKDMDVHTEEIGPKRRETHRLGH